MKIVIQNKKAIILSLIVTGVYLFNFFHQVRYGSGETDSYYHLSYVRSFFYDGYLPKSQQSYPLFFYVIALFVVIFRNYTVAALLFIMIWAFATNILQIKLIDKLLDEKNSNYSVLLGSGLSFIWPISFHAFDFLKGETTYWSSMLHVYLTSGSTAPYHNLTYLCAKPFAILTIYAFLTLLQSDKKAEQVKMAIILAVSMLLSVLAKPCFYQCFAPAGALFVIVYFLLGHFDELKKCITIAISFVPATIWVLYSMTMKVQPIAFSPFEGMMFYNADGTNGLIILSRAIFYVLFVVVCMFVYRQNNNNMILGGLIYLFGVAEWILFIFPLEKGALDMMWGYNMSMYLLFLFAIVTAKRIYNVKHNKVVFYFGNLIFAFHTTLGLLMFINTWIKAYYQYFFE
ncbi:hypothetical protein SAMN02745247_03041 [Butyrivibrio hungatei DSM 14810]|uniref:Mannosyltransferase related to Gpi18 n=1 Tax=Butyrivibrio hungatei DSM 14810 TaxID=1121132 RepID=A0A1M7T5C3_9FIRM|nr:hypothetical protein [Butyrivibrio hungatei]SHN65904.1 hypothetical protein SAMN02745247_03041 [Butyrivibrio hungatei DSM 14810]